MMRRKRGIIHIVILAMAAAIGIMMFTTPLIRRALLPEGTESSYMQLCGMLARALSREKNVGLALTLFAMALGFFGMLITALLTPFVRTLRKTRDGLGALSGMLALLPLVLLAARSAEMLQLAGVPDAATAQQSVLTFGGYALAILVMIFILLCTSGLVVGIHVKSAAARPAPIKPVPKPQQPDETAQKDRKERNVQQPAAVEGEGGAAKKTPAAEGARESSAGEALEDAAQDDAEITVVRTVDNGPACGVIEGLEGVYAGARIEIGADETILFGRNPKYAHVVIDRNNADISRRHCGVCVEERSGKYLVTDFSRNGTFARAVDAGEEMRLSAKKATRLPKGTVIRLGRRGNTFLLQ